KDGGDTKYYVELVDTGTAGEITLTYTTASNTLNLETTNLKKLTINCKNIYYKKCQQVFKRDPYSNEDYYKKYFIDKDLFVANVKTDNKIDELRWQYMPEPQKVLVNDVEWFEDTKWEYESQAVILTNVPQGTTNVKVYFKPKINPIARISLTGTFLSEDKKITYGEVGKEITFDASESSDDVEIVEYDWDFGDESTGSGDEVDHTYDKVGVYTVNLTVTDDLGLPGYAEKSLTIVKDKADLDGDAMPDIWEESSGNLLDTTINDANEDKDNDGLTNLQEYENNTFANKADSDNDDYPDLEEIQKGSNPRDKTSVPKKPAGDGDEDNLLMILMVVAVIIIILIILVLVMLIKKRKKREEEEEVPAPEAVAEGAAEEGPAAEKLPPTPPTMGAPPTPIPPAPMPMEEYPMEGEEAEAGERPYTPTGEPEPPLYKVESEFPYTAADEEVSHEDLALDIEGLSISPEEGLGVEEGVPPGMDQLPEEELPPEEEEIPAEEEELPPEEEPVEGEPDIGLGLEEDLLDIGGEELLEDEGLEKPMGGPELEEGGPVPTPEEGMVEEEPIEEEYPPEEELPPEVPELTVKDYVKQGAIHFKNGDYTDAIIEWQKALDLEPDHPEIVASIKEAMAKLKGEK
ncbi:PKD domain-containing protein, partial [[Eubacterium] cellulosolvens]